MHGKINAHNGMIEVAVDYGLVVLALLVAVWSLSTVLMEWTVDPALVGIVLAGAVGIALIGGGITGAARRRDHP